MRVIPASRLSRSAASRTILQDRFGARSVRFPLLISEKAGVLNSVPSAPGGGMCRSSAGSVFHTSSLAPWPAFTGFVSTPRPGLNPVTWNIYMAEVWTGGIIVAHRPLFVVTGALVDQIRCTPPQAAIGRLVDRNADQVVRARCERQASKIHVAGAIPCQRRIGDATPARQ